MATTDDKKLRSIAGILGVGSLALLGVTACDDNGTTDDGGVEDPADPGVDNGDDMDVDDPAEDEDEDL